MVQHGLNLVFVLVELMLNSIPFHPYLMGFMGMYSAAYALWAFTFYSNSGKWIYPVPLPPSPSFPPPFTHTSSTQIFRTTFLCRVPIVG
jgi:hypothetical protein